MNSDENIRTRYIAWIKKISAYLKTEKSGSQITKAMGQYLSQIGNLIIFTELAKGELKEEELKPLLSDLQNLTEILIEYFDFRPTLEERVERLVLHTRIARPTVLESGEVLR